MPLMLRTLCIIISLLTVTVCASEGKTAGDTRKVVYTRAFDGDSYGYYHVAVLKAVLAATNDDYGLAIAEAHPQPMPQARQIITLQKGEADLMWSATSDDREAALLPVKFPLLQGLAGYRVFIIRADNQAAFPADMSRRALQRLRAVQGADWPDLAVLKENGFRVDGADWSMWFASMYNSVQKGLVDYFPRNVIEVYNDLERHKDKNVALEKHLMLYYPNYEYFFARPGKEELVKRLYDGLTRILRSGELTEIFLQHDNHRQALALVEQSDRKIFDLTNPTLGYALTNTAWVSSPDTVLEALSSQ